ncbi:MAG: signal peptide protein [Limisphaerales bacterium]|nr:MAG: signal peptide protein [Limisphaerales bacterium]KAG0507161.1 MAG: signal peptide protein [Limisphaerales bacterium]TXT47624.1 MAG: signal peptide protein [Limisphaerales bacterium]
MTAKFSPRWFIPGFVVAAVCWLGGMGFFQPVPSAGAAEPRARSGESPAVVAARERAALTHIIYATTMEMLHRHYFRRGQAVLPARAMEDVFADVAEQTKVEGNWIAVNTKAMSLHHEPKTDFEKRAAAAIAAGQERFEIVDKDFLRIARPIPLGEGCVNCHTGMFRSPPSSPRLAGLIVTVPLK